VCSIDPRGLKTIIIIIIIIIMNEYYHSAMESKNLKST